MRLIAYPVHVDLVGRSAELARLHELIESCSRRSRVVTIEGAAGLGKTALLNAARDAALASGVAVLTCGPAEVEQGYDFAALGDLLAPIADVSALQPSLDPVLCASLDAVLLRGAPRGAPPEPRSIGLALVGVVRSLVDRGRLVLLLDDVQWMDPASAAALTFAARRLPDAGVLVLAARRVPSPGFSLPGETLPLDPLTSDAVTDLLRVADTPGRRLTVRELRTIVATVEGNPMFAIELARHAARSASGDALSLPRSLRDVVSTRLAGVSDDVRGALSLLALAARPDAALIRALGINDLVAEAEVHGLLDTTSARVAFGHPLLAAALRDDLTPTARRRAHHRLADAVSDPAWRVWHAAHAADTTDGGLAERSAAESAALVARGAHEQAADLAILAARLTPRGDAAFHSRHVTAAELAFQRGEGAVTREMLSTASGNATTLADERREQMVRAVAEYSLGADARQAALAALAACTTDAERVEVQSLLARVSYDDFDVSLAHADEAFRLAERCELPAAVRVQVLTARATEAFMAGHGLDREMFERAMQLEREEAGPQMLYSANSAFASYAALLKIAGEFTEARAMLGALLDGNEDDGTLPFALSHLPQLELWTGNWDAAEDLAHRHLDVALRAGQEEQAEQARNNLAQVHLYKGDVAEAAAIAAEMLERGRAAGDLWTERNGLGLLGLVALAEGDAARAMPLLQRWHSLSEQMHLREPGYCRLRAELVEALVATGHLDDAESIASQMSADAVRLQRPLVGAVAARVAALAAAARGDRAAALDLAGRAAADLAKTDLVFEHARALLTLGQIHRRFKEKSAARDALQAAMAIFVQLGAERFAERCRQDLARISLRAPASTALTETERRVAELAATGRTVRQVADVLFISPKTVEANLTRVYRKLGLSGRAELARWAATNEVDSAR